jgi:hypothetical protein
MFATSKFPSYPSLKLITKHEGAFCFYRGIEAKESVLFAVFRIEHTPIAVVSRNKDKGRSTAPDSLTTTFVLTGSCVQFFFCLFRKRSKNPVLLRARQIHPKPLQSRLRGLELALLGGV